MIGKKLASFVIAIAAGASPAIALAVLIYGAIAHPAIVIATSVVAILGIVGFACFALGRSVYDRRERR